MDMTYIVLSSFGKGTSRNSMALGQSMASMVYMALIVTINGYRKARAGTSGSLRIRVEFTIHCLTALYH